jgi:SMC interacting uncharacterized protein involved in chromosome segregation
MMSGEEAKTDVAQGWDELTKGYRSHKNELKNFACKLGDPSYASEKDKLKSEIDRSIQRWEKQLEDFIKLLDELPEKHKSDEKWFFEEMQQMYDMEVEFIKGKFSGMDVPVKSPKDIKIEVLQEEMMDMKANLQRKDIQLDQYKADIKESESVLRSAAGPHYVKLKPGYTYRKAGKFGTFE